MVTLKCQEIELIIVVLLHQLLIQLFNTILEKKKSFKIK